MIAVIFIPANRMKNVFVLLGILLFIVLYIAFRMLKPERFVDPEAFSTVLVYVKSLQTPSTPLLPSTWAFDAVRAALTGNYTEALFHLGLSVGFAGLIIYTAVMIADLIYFKGFSKTQTSAARLFRNRISAERLFAFLPGPIRAFTLKEIRTFLRDQAQWSQIFLIGALVVIYIYNFSVLPLDKSPIRTVYLQNLLSFLNMGLALFVLTAVTARFAYPAVSTETNAFWIVRTAPIPIKSYLKIKFFIYFIPLLILTEILIVATNLLLQVTPFMMALSTITVFCIVPGIVCMGIGLGAAYPDFKAENPMQTVTSFGGVLFMILCAGFIALVMILEAGPVQNIFFSDLWRIRLPLTRWLYILVSFAAVFCLCCLAVVIPMRYGERKLTKHPV
jgi:ABC-2 type transport system permease protein